jgi:rhamnose transport system permease protein
MSGFMAAVAGIVLASRFGSTRPDIALGMELDVITTTVLGGVSISGGSGTMIGAVLSLILIGELRFGMGLLNIQGQVQGVIIGLLLIISILLPNLIQMVTRRGFAMSRRAWFGAVAGIAVLALFLWFFMWSRALYLTTL